MTPVPCPLCGGDRAAAVFNAREFVLDRREYQHTRCGDCGHLFVNPAPDGAELEGFYAEVMPRLRAMFPQDPAAAPDAVGDSFYEQEKVEFVGMLVKGRGRETKHL